MNKARFTMNALVVVLFTLVLASLAQAQATRTWVSGVGDDVNPCSRTAPCKTFAGAISKTAPNGEINVLDPGGFGAVTITKSITIDGGGFIAGVLVSGTNGIIINGAGIDVTLRGLDIDGLTTGLDGIKILQANRVSIEGCQIYGFAGSGVNSRGISDERTTGGNLAVRNTIVRNNSGSGVVILPSSGATTITASIDNVRSDGNGSSGFVADNGSRVTISNSVAFNNTSQGFIAEGPGGASELNLENCVASGNGTGVIVLGGGTIRLSNVHVANSTTNGVTNSGGTFVSFGNNKIVGNAGNNSLGVPVTNQQ